MFSTFWTATRKKCILVFPLLNLNRNGFSFCTTFWIFHWSSQLECLIEDVLFKHQLDNIQGREPTPVKWRRLLHFRLHGMSYQLQFRIVWNHWIDVSQQQKDQMSWQNLLVRFQFFRVVWCFGLCFFCCFLVEKTYVIY